MLSGQVLNFFRDGNGARSINTPKTKQEKDLLYGVWPGSTSRTENFSRGTQRVIPSGQDSGISPPRVANQSPGSGSSCPLTEL